MYKELEASQITSRPLSKGIACPSLPTPRTSWRLWHQHLQTLLWWACSAQIQHGSPYLASRLRRLTVQVHSAGTMLFGESTSAAEADVLLDTAAELGITFFDTAEMYPVPQSAETQGLSEVILGRWLRRQRRYQGSLFPRRSGRHDKTTALTH